MAELTTNLRLAWATDLHLDHCDEWQRLELAEKCAELQLIEVYCLTSPSGRRYVGFASRGMDKRWRRHVNDAKNGSEVPLHRAIRKHGHESFTRSLLERVTTETGAKLAEKLWIKELGTFMPDGYNATLGGDGLIGHVHSVETRAKIGAASRGRTPSPETRLKISEANRGKKRSPEARAKLAEAQLGKKASPETLAKMAESQRGRKHSPESISKTAAANRGRKRSPEARANMSKAQALRQAKAKALPNHEVLAGASEYGAPEIARVFDV